MPELRKSALVANGREHWEANLPGKYQYLLEAGQLHQALSAAAEQTLRAMQRLHAAGANEWEAWEIARERHLILPHEGSSEGRTCYPAGLHIGREA